MNLHIQKKRKGFSLIELFVILFIIIILTVVALATFRQYFKEVRDSTRKAEISTIANVVKSSRYKNERQMYASTTAILQDNFSKNNLITPSDPGDGCYVYAHKDGKDFFIATKLEKTDQMIIDGGPDGKNTAETYQINLYNYIESNCADTSPNIPDYSLFLINGSIVEL